VDLGPGPVLMGVINVTPDSFSDGGLYLDVDKAVEHGHELVREGAAILDIGGESTRPGADEVPEAEEIERVVPAIERLAQASGPDAPRVSIDTRKARVAEQALQAGARTITSAVRGMMLTSQATRAEAMALIHSGTR